MFVGGAGIGMFGNTNPPAGQLQVNGTVVATNFAGNGGGLTNLNGANIQAGTLSSNAMDANTWALMTNSTSSALPGQALTNYDSRFALNVATTFRWGWQAAARARWPQPSMPRMAAIS